MVKKMTTLPQIKTFQELARLAVLTDDSKPEVLLSLNEGKYLIQGTPSNEGQRVRLASPIEYEINKGSHEFQGIRYGVVTPLTPAWDAMAAEIGHDLLGTSVFVTSDNFDLGTVYRSDQSVLP